MAKPETALGILACHHTNEFSEEPIMNRLIPEVLDDTVRRFPERTAFTDPVSSITFSELHHNIEVLASQFATLCPPRSIIGFYMDKSVLTVTGFLAAVYAGCAYSQLNLRHPAARILAIADTLSSPFLVTDRDHEEALRATGYVGTILLIEELLKGDKSPELLEARRAQMLDIDPLYVNFTSGSTGNPKGVVISHRNVMDFIPDFIRIFKITETDVLANQAPFDFDVSVKDIYSGLFSGAEVLIVPTPYFTQPVTLMDYLCDHGTTVMVWAVSALCFLTTMNALQYRTPDKMRMILFSGETMPIKHLHKLMRALPDVCYVNLYGPTEITCNCTYYIVDRPFEENESLPIGIPFPNERVFLLDENNNMVTSVGESGEICVSGSCVGLGYLGNTEKTEQAFVQNPLNTRWLETIYRTGDLARINERGEIVYISRKDFQVKHMGHRIELGEIETQLSAVPGIERAVCIYLHEKSKILAFIVGNIEKADITEHLRVALPEYMIPNIYSFVDVMPLNKNGKIDRNLLLQTYLEKKGKH